MRVVNIICISPFLFFAMGTSGLTVTDELLEEQVESLRMAVSRADANGDGVLSSNEYQGMAELMQDDPLVRPGFARLTRTGNPTVDTYRQYDLDGDGEILVSDISNDGSVESLKLWDFDGDGILGSEELSQLDGLIQFQAFTTGAGGNTQGLGPVDDIINSLELEGSTRVAVADAIRNESQRIPAYQREVHQLFFADLKGLLGDALYEEFIDSFAETLITRPVQLNPNAAAVSHRTIVARLTSYDSNSDQQLAGEELTEALKFMATIRIENAPEDYTFWQRNQHWIDYDDDQTIYPGDIPFLSEEIFSRFDSNQDDLIDPEEFIAMRDDRMAQYMRREVPLLRFGYDTMVPVLEQMGA